MARAKSQQTPPDWRAIFLKELARLPNVTAAAKKARVSRSHAYAQRDEDPDFALAWEDALEQAVDRIEGEAYRRSVYGTLEPVYYMGEKVGNVRKYSTDGLIMFLMKAHRPEKYRDQNKLELEHKGSITGNVKHEIDGETAESIFDVLAAAGVFQPGDDDPETDPVHSPHSDG